MTSAHINYMSRKLMTTIWFHCDKQDPPSHDHLTCFTLLIKILVFSLNKKCTAYEKTKCWKWCSKLTQDKQVEAIKMWGKSNLLTFSENTIRNTHTHTPMHACSFHLCVGVLQLLFQFQLSLCPPHPLFCYCCCWCKWDSLSGRALSPYSHCQMITNTFLTITVL